jgi:fructose-1,6-bisphosphatase/inositol monophosphatase family enzyme
VTLNRLELESLKAFRSGAPMPSLELGETEAWVRFAIVQLLIAGRELRSAQSELHKHVEIKDDGTPTVLVEQQVELRLREALAEFAPDAAVIGEETGGTFPSSGLAVAIDPVDGTWAFVAGTETYTTVLTVFRDGAPLLGFVLNPTTGELGYALAGGPSRLLQLSLYGEPDAAVSLPMAPDDRAKILVNVHPGAGAARLVDGLYGAWRRGDLQMVRSPGGSPSWALLEAAKGAFVYANIWAKQPAEPFDLAAGALLVRGAGGEVIDLNDRPIDAARHAGLFVAGIDARARAMVAEIARQVVSHPGT